MLYALFGLPIFLLLFIASVYFANCGFSADCSQASLPDIIHTPIPTLIPATLPDLRMVKLVEANAECLVTARTLLSSWVDAGFQETQFFEFRDIKGNNCQATFADVTPLFNKANFWYKGALACDSCHNSNLSLAAANLDLSSYSGILAGRNRTSSSTQGEDILGGGNWDKSLLNNVLFVDQLMPFGHPPKAGEPDGPTINTGTLVSNLITTPTEPPTESEVARPSNPGGPGDAINLTGNITAGQKVYVDHCQVCHGVEGRDDVLNPGSDDGTVPSINPIDDTLVSPDYKTYAYNLDLFIQDGSTPPGLNPVFLMPAWGAQNGLTQQQIADVIAYTISLNK
jgi:mono/diheme cytochrome c family protein